MKKLIYILSIILLFSGCKPDDVISGAALSFFPTTVNTAIEEDGITYVLSLETSGVVGNGSAVVEVDLSAEGVIFTNPPLNGGQLTLEIVDGTTSQIEVTVLNDLTPEDYTALFRIVSVSGDLGGIGTDEFTLFVLDNDNVPIYEENFDNGLGNFTVFSEVGTQEWSATDFGNGGTGGVRMNGFSGGAQDNQDWLISEAIDLSGLTSASIQFVTDVAFEQEPVMEIRVSTDYDGGGDPTQATWTTLDATYDDLTGFDTWTPTGKIDVSDFLTAETYFAFYYFSSTDAGAAQWTIDDFSVSVFNPDASGGGNENLRLLPFTEDFENCTEDFATPSSFEIQYAEGSKDDRGWGCRQFGVDGSRGVRVNTFGGDAGTSDTWLITQNKFDLTTISSGLLQFDIKSASSGDGDLRVYYSTDYFGVLALSTWTELADVQDQLPVQGSDLYSTVETTIPGGEVVYLAFQFAGSSESNSATYDIDNILFEDGCRNVDIGTPVTAITLPYTEDFESGLDGWNVYNPDGNNTWELTEFENNTTAISSGFESGNVGGEDNWLISGEIDFDAQEGEELNFISKGRFNFESNRLEVYILSSYSGVCDDTERTALTVTLDPHSGTGFGTFTASGSIDLSAFSGTGYLAFRYVPQSSTDESGWEIDDITITSN